MVDASRLRATEPNLLLRPYSDGVGYPSTFTPQISIAPRRALVSCDDNFSHSLPASVCDSLRSSNTVFCLEHRPELSPNEDPFTPLKSCQRLDFL
ncbi:hypothetical protein CGGC5_v015567 [Colletotrichum fructicola Nara gc5]|uniref:Uncharacterized protein n=1 Tax=Colletotrichum fructicola (strain Nara gc5) TaxID=1213859 RepID=A0A7J6IG52_COLFN|nr:hypothetical protein CGGC5_v015567 [Colletotrichum fructicola Nara gc5]